MSFFNLQLRPGMATKPHAYLRPLQVLPKALSVLALGLGMARRRPAASSALLALLLFIFSMGTLWADDPLEKEAREIAKLLQCPVCQNLSVADSPSDLAQQMRALIRKKLEEGETREAIIQYFAERYGEWILMEPPKQGFALAVWVAPVLMLIAGGAVVFWVLRTWQSQSASGGEADSAALSQEELGEYKARLEDELATYEKG